MFKRKAWLYILIVLGLILMSATALAASEVVVSITGARGSAGDRVEIIINFDSLPDSPTFTGISGGEFELVYDPSLAIPVKPITKGDALSGFLFMGNAWFTEESIKAVFASSEKLITQAGELCRFTFELKKDVTIQPTIRNAILRDQNIQPLAVRIVELSLGGKTTDPPETPADPGSGNENGTDDDDSTSQQDEDDEDIGESAENPATAAPSSPPNETGQTNGNDDVGVTIDDSDTTNNSETVSTPEEKNIIDESSIVSSPDEMGSTSSNRWIIYLGAALGGVIIGALLFFLIDKFIILKKF